jgi:chromosome segregation ATPase
VIPNVVGLQLAAMESQLGRLSGLVRGKDGELAALNDALAEQFAQRNVLRGDAATVQGQLQRLQAAYAGLQAQLAESESARASLMEQHRCAAAACAVLP